MKFLQLGLLSLLLSSVVAKKSKDPAAKAPKAKDMKSKSTKASELPPATYSVTDSLVYCESIYETFDTSDMSSGNIFVEVVFKEIDTVHFNSFDLCRMGAMGTLEYHGTISEKIPILGVLTNEKQQWRLLANPLQNPALERNPCSGIDLIASAAFSFYFNTSTTVNDPLDFSIGYMIDQCIRSTAE